jgi:hypothetical protein
MPDWKTGALVMGEMGVDGVEWTESVGASVRIAVRGGEPSPADTRPLPECSTAVDGGGRRGRGRGGHRCPTLCKLCRLCVTDVCGRARALPLQSNRQPIPIQPRHKTTPTSAPSYSQTCAKTAASSYDPTPSSATLAKLLLLPHSPPRRPRADRHSPTPSA